MWMKTSLPPLSSAMKPIPFVSKNHFTIPKICTPVSVSGFWPAANVPRTGIRLGDLDDPARQLVHALLRASASSQGYLKIAGIMQHDDLLPRPASARVGMSADS
jgi:hypothetical protein